MPVGEKTKLGEAGVNVRRACKINKSGEPNCK